MVVRFDTAMPSLDASASLSLSDMSVLVDVDAEFVASPSSVHPAKENRIKTKQAKEPIKTGRDVQEKVEMRMG